MEPFDEHIVDLGSTEAARDARSVAVTSRHTALVTGFWSTPAFD